MEAAHLERVRDRPYDPAATAGADAAAGRCESRVDEPA